jgi:hypothetical protein
VTIQVIIVKHNHDSLINITYSLTTSRLTWKSDYSYPRVAAIRIDVHPAGETRLTHHTHFTPGSRMALDHMCLMWSAYSNLLWVINSVGQLLLLLRKSAPDSTSQPDWVAHGTRLSFSPNIAIEAVGLIQVSVDDRWLTGANPSVINRHRRGIQPWRCRLATSHSPTFSTDGLHFPP